MLFRTALLSSIAFGAVRAQPTSKAVSGTVYDSVGNAPLVGAIVQAVLIDSPPGPPRAFSAISDATGHYRIEGLPAGRFGIAFQHRSLDVLGIETPIRAFIRGDEPLTVDLAIPSGASVRTLACGKDQRLEGEGMLVGYVLDARGQGVLKGAVVKVRWVELALERKNYHSVTRVVTALVDDEGKYRACGVTSDDAVTLEVSMPGYRVVTNPVTIPPDGAVRQDFRLASTEIVRGTSTMAGRVMSKDGAPLGVGRATIPALALETPIRAGDFNFSNLPNGTWLVEVTSLGLEPQSALVDVMDGIVASPRITMSDRAQMLDAVMVLGRRGGSDKILKAIDARRKYANGTVFLPGNDWLAIARDPADLVRDAAGFKYVSSEKVLASGCGYKDIPTERVVEIASVQKPRQRALAIYLDGLRVVGGLPELRTAVTMRDVLAVEAYQDVATAPIEWRTYDACAVLAIWTKR